MVADGLDELNEDFEDHEIEALVNEMIEIVSEDELNEGPIDNMMARNQPIKGMGTALARRVAPKLAKIKPNTSNIARQIKQKKIPDYWGKLTTRIINKGVPPSKLNTAVQRLAVAKKEKDRVERSKKAGKK